MDKRILGVAALAAGGLASNANAGLVYGTTQLGLHTEAGNSENDGKNADIELDFNSDGNGDLKVESLTKNSTGTNRYNINGHVADDKNPTGTRYVIAPYAGDTSGNPAQAVRPAVLQAGQSVGPLSTFGLDSGGSSNSLADNRNGGGPFATDGSEQFIGVELTSSAGVNYGFVGIKLFNSTATSPSDTLKSYEITQYAYESTPGVAAVIPGVPEPVSLAALALGSVGLLARRRQD